MLAHAVSLGSKEGAFGFEHLGRRPAGGVGWAAVEVAAGTEDTASPKSSAFCDTEEEAPVLDRTTTPVKNTFIQFDCAEQPDYRPCKSGPAKISRILDTRSLTDLEEEQQQEPHLDYSGVPSVVNTHPEAERNQDTASPKSSAVCDTEEEAPVLDRTTTPVKNTFIQFDCSEQPDYRPCKSGPAKVSRILETHSLLDEEEEPHLDYNVAPSVVCTLPEAERNQDTASPKSSAFCDTEEEAPGLERTTTPVKNTFIQFDCSEQPDYRPCKSGPAKVSRILETPSLMDEGEEQQQDTASPKSSAACDTEEEAPGLERTTTPVKNTFIHYDCAEQPDYRPCKSGPAKISRRLDPPFLMEEEEEQQQELPAPAPARPLLRPPPPAHDPPPPAQQPPAPAPAGGAAAAEESSRVSVKNTFIHFEMEEIEQPDYRPAKSGPAKLLLSTLPEEPAWIPLPDEKASQYGEEQGSFGQQPALAGGLPSRGSSGHAEGTCRPCAHIWKAGGCSKGFECTFCHLCEEDDFRRKRREKLVRLKTERATMRKMAEAAAAVQEEVRQPSTFPGPDHVQDLAPGELAVTYNGQRATVLWAVDLRRLRSQHRCGLSRRLSLRMGGRDEVPFVLFISPSAAESVEAAGAPGRGGGMTFNRSQASASMQLKCMDASQLAQARALLSVAFAAGDLAARQASPGHDFALESVCKLPPQEDAWDLLAAVGQGVNCCVLRAELELVARDKTNMPAR